VVEHLPNKSRDHSLSPSISKTAFLMRKQIFLIFEFKRFMKMQGILGVILHKLVLNKISPPNLKRDE
jgi:hypothetical protein